MTVARRLFALTLTAAVVFVVWLVWPQDPSTGPHGTVEVVPDREGRPGPVTTLETQGSVVPVGDETLLPHVDLIVYVAQLEIVAALEAAEPAPPPETSGEVPRVVEQPVAPPSTPPTTAGQPAPEPQPEPEPGPELAEPVTIEARSIRDLICSYPWDCQTALRIAQCESGLNPAAVGGAGERGIMQIHPVHAPRLGARWDRMFDPATNIQAAYEMWSSQGWVPWSCK